MTLNELGNQYEQFFPGIPYNLNACVSCDLWAENGFLRLGRCFVTWSYRPFNTVLNVLEESIETALSQIEAVDLQCLR